MSVEIERKFLIKKNELGNIYNGEKIVQGYFNPEATPTTRVRIYGGKGYLTIKGKTDGISRPEFEYEIPLADAEHMIKNFCPVKLEKTRFLIEVGNHTWEVDEFHGDNEGLFVAEIELESETEEFKKPEWLGEEVSHDTRYYNSNLITHPFNKWQK